MKPLLKYAYYILGEGVSKGVIFLTFSFYTSYFAKEEFGRLSLFWITIPLASIFIDLAQRSYIKRQVIFSKKKAAESIYRVLITSTLTASFFLIIGILLNSQGVYIIDETFDKYIIICAYFFAIIEAGLSYFQIGGDIKSYNVFYALRNALPYILTLTIALALKGDIKFEPILFSQVQVITFIVITCVLFYGIYLRHLDINFSAIKENLKSRVLMSLRFSLPIVPGVLSALLLSFADRFIINFYYSEVEVAEYTVAYTVASIFMAFFLATNKMWQKFILDNLKANNINKIAKAAKKYLFVVVVIGLIVVLLRSVLVATLANESYFNILDIIPTIVFGMFFYFLYTVLSNIPFFYKNTMLMALPAIIAALLNIILNFALIPKYGYKIAAITTTISYFVEFLIIYIICLKKYKTDILFNGFTKRFIS